MAGNYDFLFETPPSPRTIQRIYDAIQIRRDKLKKEYQDMNPFMSAKIEELTELMSELQNLKKELEIAHARGNTMIYRGG